MGTTLEPDGTGARFEPWGPAALPGQAGAHGPRFEAWGLELSGAGASASRRRRARRMTASIILGVVVATVAITLSARSGAASSPPGATAAAINLRAGDLPGFAVAASSPFTIGGQPQERFNGCLGVGLQLVAYTAGSPPAAGLVAIASPEFVEGTGAGRQTVSSSVAFGSSPALVAGALASASAQLADGRLRDCAAQALDGTTYHYANGGQLALSGVAIAPLRVAIPGATASLGVRIAMTVSGQATSMTLYADVYEFAVGRDALMLTTAAAEQPFPASSAQALSALLVARALAHPH